MQEQRFIDDLFEKVGYFDEDFFAYLEDVDLNLRANMRGLKCLYVPTAEVFHMGSATTGSTINSFTVRLSTKNALNLVVKNYGLQIFLKALPVILVYHLVWFLGALRTNQASAYLDGIRGALRDFPKMWRKRTRVLSEQTVSTRLLFSRILRWEKEIMESILESRRRAGEATWPVRVYLKLFF